MVIGLFIPVTQLPQTDFLHLRTVWHAIVLISPTRSQFNQGRHRNRSASISTNGGLSAGVDTDTDNASGFERASIRQKSSVIKV
jgi:hypothetical protein